MKWNVLIAVVFLAAGALLVLNLNAASSDGLLQRSLGQLGLTRADRQTVPRYHYRYLPAPATARHYLRRPTGQSRHELGRARGAANPCLAAREAGGYHCVPGARF